MPAIEFRRLAVADAEDYRTIRLAALKGAPDAFGSTYEVEADRPTAEFADRLTTSAVFAAYAEGRVIGMAGFKQQTGARDGHKGFIWGVYVEPEARGQGVAKNLIAAVIASASEIVEQLTVTVVQGNDTAIALYRKFGFEIYGVEPRSLKASQGYVDEVLMARILDDRLLG